MSDSLEINRTGVPADATSNTKTLRNLYFGRFGFAIVWAILLVLTAKTINPGSAILLVIYPLFDVVAAVIDYRSSGYSRPKGLLYVNMALSLLAAIGIAVTLASGIPGILRIWGVWAITAGIVQLIVAITRFRLGGQIPMILSGAISVVAGADFILTAAGPKASLTTVGGYAVLGGLFFLISAIRLRLVVATVANAND